MLKTCTFQPVDDKEDENELKCLQQLEIYKNKYVINNYGLPDRSPKIFDQALM